MDRIQALAAVFRFYAFTCSRVPVDEATQQAVGLAEIRTQGGVGQTLFHGHGVAEDAQVATSLFFHVLEVVGRILPVQRRCAGSGDIWLLGLVVVPDPVAHAKQHKDGKGEQDKTQNLNQQIFCASQEGQHRQQILVKSLSGLHFQL